MLEALEDYVKRQKKRLGNNSLIASGTAKAKNNVANENERGRQRPYYLRRLRSQMSLTSKTAIINTIATKMGAANIANIVSIFAVPRANNARERAKRGFVPRPVQIRPLGGQNRPVS
jgi:hypothetical protein